LDIVARIDYSQQYMDTAPVDDYEIIKAACVHTPEFNDHDKVIKA